VSALMAYRTCPGWFMRVGAGPCSAPGFAASWQSALTVGETEMLCSVSAALLSQQ